jgi:hypothetical protein
VRPLRVARTRQVSARTFENNAVLGKSAVWDRGLGFRVYAVLGKSAVWDRGLRACKSEVDKCEKEEEEEERLRHLAYHVILWGQHSLIKARRCLDEQQSVREWLASQTPNALAPP